MQRPSLTSMGWTLLLAFATLSGCSEGPGEPKHLILITLDTTRADHLSCYGYERETTPFLDDLAERGSLFENAYSSSPLTMPSHSTIMTGTFPYFHGVLDNGLFKLADENITLAERLGENGFTSGAVIAAAVLRPLYGIDQGFDHYDADVWSDYSAKSHMAERRASVITDRALQWVQTQDADRLFLWAHYFDPHAPFVAPKEFGARFPDRPYDAEIAYTDHEVGRLLDGLDERGILNDSVVVVVSDHGEGLGDHREVTHGFFIYDETVKVPLIMAGPGVPEGVRVDSMTRTADIVPTALELLGLPSAQPESMEGHSLVAAMNGEEVDPQDAYFETWMPQFSFGFSALQGLRHGETGYKIIDAPEPELYDVRNDPEEKNNLFPQQKDRFESLLARMNAMREIQAERAMDSLVQVSEASRAELEALGYVTGSVDKIEKLGPDPKQGYRYLELYETAQRTFDAGRHEEALAMFETLVREVPKKSTAQEMLGTALNEYGEMKLRQGEREQALALNERAIENFKQACLGKPHDVIPAFNLALAYRLKGDRELQLKQLETCLKLDPEHPNTLFELGVYYGERAEYDRALEFLRRFAAIRPLKATDGLAIQGALKTGAYLYRKKDMEGAVRQLEACLALGDVGYEARYWLARMAFDEGKKGRAKTHLKKYFERAPASAEDYARARRLYGKVDR